LELKPHELYNDLTESREALDEFYELFIKASKFSLEDTLLTTDLFIVAIAQRSIDIIEAYKHVIDSWNITCAGPLIRMQLDNLLRLVYISKIKNSDELTLEILNGKSFYDFRDSDGKKLTDSRLRQYAKENYPWVDDIYKKASQFVHFSELHMRLPIEESNEENTIAFSIRKPSSDKVSKKDIESYFEIMIMITQEILRYIVSWGRHKKKNYA
jgi:hypothetical protein